MKETLQSNPKHQSFLFTVTTGWVNTLAHTIKSLAYSLRPKRISSVFPMCMFLTREYYRTIRYDQLPNIENATNVPDGLCGLVRDLKPGTLREAYKAGMFPRNHIGPIKWWAPSQRTILFFDEYKIDKNVRRRLRNSHFTFTIDQTFTDVVKACAEPRPGTVGLTWINERIIRAFTKAHEVGDAHSLEVWDKEGNLVGGIYGYVAGRVFFTESQFYRSRDASKTGFAVLNRHLQHWGFVVNDAKDYTPHLASLGFSTHPRAVLNSILSRHGSETVAVSDAWQINDDLCGGDWEPEAKKLKQFKDTSSGSSQPKYGVVA